MYLTHLKSCACAYLQKSNKKMMESIFAYADILVHFSILFSYEQNVFWKMWEMEFLNKASKKNNTRRHVFLGALAFTDWRSN